MNKMMPSFRVLYLYLLLLCFIESLTSQDTITQGNFIRDGETLVSSNGFFELGFFSPGSPTLRYLGIWYRKSPSTVFWVANRNISINNDNGKGLLRLNDQGVLLLLDAKNNTMWSSDNSSTTTRIKANNPFAQLLDTGNLVVKNDALDPVWQSFDYPCDTLMPGMKLGWDQETGLDKVLSSWKSSDDPSQGDYINKIDRKGYPQYFQLRGSKVMYRAGSWNGKTFTGLPNPNPDPLVTSDFVVNEKEVYFTSELRNNSIFSRFVLLSSGVAQRFDWVIQTSSWQVTSTASLLQCENYAFCGANSICNSSDNPVCKCLRGYEPKNFKEWNVSVWNSGCTRRVSLDCGGGDGFKLYTSIKLPDTSFSWYNTTMNLGECKKTCLQNCSCAAYSNLDIRGQGSGCLLWLGQLLDMRQFPEGGQDLNVRVPASEQDHFRNEGRGSIGKKTVAGIVVGCAIFVMSFMILGLTLIAWKRKLRNSGKEVMDIPIFDLSIITKATDNFSTINKLGEGGFGPVYKGTLEDGQELAVKRLSAKSGQGIEELKNEIVLIAKLQHRNLVKLLGCCIVEDEKLLIYEYMPNKSLDQFIFDVTRSNLLDWPNRWNIIHGIARGLVYLHIDSRLRIIHRDLKTSNILLDAYMNPKISDFGLARTFWDDQVDANTDKIVGTHGYMPPEYILHGRFSMKSDVFSFGVIVLEIVIGKKNRGFLDQEYGLNLLGHAWRLWIQGRPMELLDECLKESCNESEVIRCIHVGLLCVQQKVEDRPDMSTVVLMLNGEKLLPQPKVPGFYTADGDGLADSKHEISQNEISQTMLEGR
ncbi:hypothetical protein QN277_008673 [Acacia crassicarpa]|uniref:Receptor-like serine/threonine-protein kinase n=1 Tax=Acacia crassicarpa TaxID=499986 RepID=A0AAE1JMA5_9FABA|nr:hypothetical protein QN277_008673 [Acacia crassicarpa]